MNVKNCSTTNTGNKAIRLKDLWQLTNIMQAENNVNSCTILNIKRIMDWLFYILSPGYVMLKHVKLTK